MSYPLAILGLLAEKPMHGYELIQTIEARGFGSFMRLSGGGVYHHLQKLEDQADIVRHVTEQSNDYPERQVYRLTTQGQHTLQKLLRDTLTDVEARRIYDPLDAALSFAHQLPLSEVRAALQYQRDMLLPISQRLQVVQRILKESDTAPTSLITLVVGHSLQRKQAELLWLEHVLAQLSSLTASPTKSKHSLYAIPPNAFWKQLDARLRDAQQSHQQRVRMAWETYNHVLSHLPATEHAEAHSRYEALVTASQTQYQDQLTSIEAQAQYQTHTGESV